MKQVILILLTSVTLSVSAQTKDTIFVSNNHTTTLVFNKDVQFTDIGNALFGAKKDGNSLFIKAIKENASSTTLLVKYGNEYYNATLVFQTVPQQTFYDYRNDYTDSDTKIIKESASFTSTEVSTDLLKSTVDMPTKYRSIGQSKNKILISLQNIETTGNEMMVKILIRNLSQVDYEIDFAKFEFEERKGGLIGKSRRIKKTPLEPIWISDDQTIEKYSETELYYILPKYSTNFIGKLKIGVWEKNGGRTIQFYVPSKYIL